LQQARKTASHKENEKENIIIIIIMSSGSSPITTSMDMNEMPGYFAANLPIFSTPS
jgi:hypothetical protein